MINTERREVVIQEIAKSVTCDKCGKTYSTDPDSQDCMELQEFHHIDFTGGYASVFGDMMQVQCDLCQHCLKEIIGPYCRCE